MDDGIEYLSSAVTVIPNRSKVLGCANSASGQQLAKENLQFRNLLGETSLHVRTLKDSAPDVKGRANL